MGNCNVSVFRLENWLGKAVGYGGKREERGGEERMDKEADDEVKIEASGWAFSNFFSLSPSSPHLPQPGG